MIQLFKFAANDKSIEYLFQIFGSMNGIIHNPQASGGPSPGVSITLLGTMFKTFNSTVLAVGALIIIYTTVVGVIGTAHEGEFMGKKFNNIWLPIRTVLGVVALIPTQSGFSVLQMIMMWVIIQGIGAADTLWNAALAYVNVVGSPYAQVTIPTVETTGVIKNIYAGLVCDATARLSHPGFNYFCASGSGGGGFCGSGSFTRFEKNATVQTGYSMGPGGACGAVALCDASNQFACRDPNSIKCKACVAQREALDHIINSILGPIATSFAKADFQYREFWANSNQSNYSAPDWIGNYCSSQQNPIPPDQCCVRSGLAQFSYSGSCKAPPGSAATFFPRPDADATRPVNANPDAVKNIIWPFAPGLKQDLIDNEGGTNFINISVNFYTGTITKVVNDLIQDQIDNPSGSRGPEGSAGIDFKKAAANGWILAGSYYYVLAASTSNNLKDAIPELATLIVDPNTPTNKMFNYRNNYTAANDLLDAASNIQRGVSPGNAEMQEAAIGIGQVFTAHVSSESGNKNALVALAALGQVMLVTATALFTVFMLTIFGVGLLAHLSPFVLGTGITNPVGPSLGSVYIVLVPAILSFISFLITFGGLLTIYLPLVPYVIFTFGAIGWMISCIETMVAGPLVALGILTPSAHGHEMLGKAEPALMLIFNNFLRPSLMIFGLMAAMLLANVVIQMIDAGYATALGPLWAGVSISVVGLVLVLCSYVMLTITALNKCFAAIYIIPENVMRWIGGAGERYGEEAALGETKRGFEAAAGGTAKGMTTAASGSQKDQVKAKRAEMSSKGAIDVAGDDVDLPGSKPPPKKKD